MNRLDSSKAFLHALMFAAHVGESRGIFQPFQNKRLYDGWMDKDGIKRKHSAADACRISLRTIDRTTCRFFSVAD